MPNPNDPLETALRRIRAIIGDLPPKQMHLIRAELVNFHNSQHPYQYHTDTPKEGAR